MQGRNTNLIITQATGNAKINCLFTKVLTVSPLHWTGISAGKCLIENTAINKLRIVSIPQFR